ncbi:MULTISPECIES: antitoxin of toxin-antitoxin stability system [Sphingobium]|jgi:hypothetical protein|uniref:antitoxin of toxin-antitoxin stability system n=1 Tax=Sphingobium TaxID=165695 RepID=UPI000DBB6202|nr:MULTISPECIES: antitoxin of toxin-antitoxin stability system [Sphingobium]KAA9017280.1 antitoxin of toxin-antitoxin stability system [Sphingobium limneticum]MBU0933271.1 antitoxin of toxin-antitoxin stability system [Alphaproteobacteria bacterium]BBD01211.1 hypothetical protein YGS_C1P2466 [Sphingobium sp. YG1]
MAKDALFTMKLEADLRDDFMAEASALHRPASQVLRELMRGFIHEQREKRSYQAFLETKVGNARAAIAAGDSLTDEEVEAQFAARRAAATRSE